MWRVAFDIGGTFTDFVLAGADVPPRFLKVASNSDDPARAVVAGFERLLAEACVAASDLRTILHATTVATNAIIERKGCPTALLTTDGFRDVLIIGRQKRYETHDLYMTKPPPLVPRRRTFEVVERVDPHGGVEIPLDPASLDAAIDAVIASGAESVAVSFLHAYANPGHEQAVAARLRERAPSLASSKWVRRAPAPIRGPCAIAAAAPARRSRTPISCSDTSIPTTSTRARCASIARLRSPGSCATLPVHSISVPRRRRGACTPPRTPTWSGPCGSSRSSAAATRASTRSSPSGVPGQCTRRGSPRRSGRRGSSSRSEPASAPPSRCCARRRRSRSRSPGSCRSRPGMSRRCARSTTTSSARAAADLERLGVEGEPVWSRSGYLRYLGQGYEIRAEFPSTVIGDDFAGVVTESFHAACARSYGYRDDTAAIEAVDWHLTATLPVEPADLDMGWRAPAQDSAAPSERQAWFPETVGFAAAAIHDRRRLGVGTAVAGPAILEEPESTVVVPPGMMARVNPQSHIVIDAGVDD